MGLFLEILISIVITILSLLFLSGFFEGGGGTAIRGTKKYKQYQKEAEKNTKEILKNNTQSSKEELQYWWDQYN